MGAYLVCLYVDDTGINVYGCAQDGTYEGEDSDGGVDKRSLNPELDDTNLEREYGDGDPVHRFVSTIVGILARTIMNGHEGLNPSNNN
jgi:hypothetical protein